MEVMDMVMEVMDIAGTEGTVGMVGTAAVDTVAEATAAVVVAVGIDQTSLEDSAKARKKQIFLDHLSNSGSAVRLYGEGRITGPPEDRYRKKENSCHSIWLPTTYPTTSTRPP
jgi:hypothetical protein